MKASRKQKPAAAKIALAIGVMILIAVLSVLTQQLLLGENNVAVTSAVISISAFTIWRLLWKST